MEMSSVQVQEAGRRRDEPVPVEEETEETERLEVMTWNGIAQTASIRTASERREQTGTEETVRQERSRKPSRCRNGVR